MNMHKLKCLPFDMWGAWHLMNGELQPEDMFSEFEQIPAIIGKPGRYYDRISKVCWTELPDGRSYKVDARMFLFELAKSYAAERPLSNEERLAATLLCKSPNLSTELKNKLSIRLYDDSLITELIRIRRDAASFRRSVLK